MPGRRRGTTRASMTGSEERAHQEEVGGVDRQLQPLPQAAMPLEEAELAQRRLLFPRSLRRERLLESRAPAIRPVVGRQVQFGEQAIAQRFAEVVLELLDQAFLADQRQQVTTSLAEEALGGLGRGLEV